MGGLEAARTHFANAHLRRRLGPHWVALTQQRVGAVMSDPAMKTRRPCMADRGDEVSGPPVVEYWSSPPNSKQNLQPTDAPAPCLAAQA